MIKYLKKKVFGDLTLVNKNEVFEKMNKIYNEHSKDCDDMENMNLNSNLKIEKLF